MDRLEIATEKIFRKNHKEKHSEDARKGWYYYVTRFAMLLYDNEKRPENTMLYSACLVINYAFNGKKYLYDVVDIKKKRVTHSRLINSQVVQNRSL